MRDMITNFLEKRKETDPKFKKGDLVRTVGKKVFLKVVKQLGVMIFKN